MAAMNEAEKLRLDSPPMFSSQEELMREMFDLTEQDM